MQGQRSHDEAYYRCRFPQEYALANSLEHPRNVYLREAARIDPLDRWLLQAFSPAHRDHTIAHLAEQATAEPPAIAIPQIDTNILAGYDAKLDRYRAALEAGADPAVVAGWIAETQAERKRALDQLTKNAARLPGALRLTPDQIGTLLDDLGELVTALKDAEPDHKSEVYQALHLKLIYEPETQTARAYVDLGQHRGDLVRVRGPTQTRRTRSHSQTTS